MNHAEQKVYDALAPLVARYNILGVRMTTRWVDRFDGPLEMRLTKVVVTTHREPGFYWVRSGGGWFVAQLLGGGMWQIPGSGVGLGDADFDDIGERVVKE